MSTKIYATLDSDNGYANENATICAFDTMDEAREYLLSPFDEEFDKSTAVIKPAAFSDCWIKSQIVETTNVEPFSIADCYIQRPGSHPGLPGFSWITPKPAVYVVASIDLVDNNA